MVEFCRIQPHFRSIYIGNEVEFEGQKMVYNFHVKRDPLDRLAAVRSVKEFRS